VARIAHCSVQSAPVPLDPAQLIKALDSRLPQFQKDDCFHPGLETIMRRRMGTQFGLIQRLPLAARPQDVEDGIGAGAISPAWSASAKAMGIDIDGEKWLKQSPQRAQRCETRSWCGCWACAVALASRVSCLLMTSIVAGYSNRLLAPRITWRV
jgi:hypothetical protein